MAQNMYALLTSMPFRRPTTPGDTLTYVRATLAGEPTDNTPLTRTEQATIDLTSSAPLLTHGHSILC